MTACKAVALLVLVCMVAVLLVVYACVSPQPDWLSAPVPGGRHGLSSPGGRYRDIVKELGPPSAHDFSPGGFAVWDQQTLAQTTTGWQYARVELRDEQIPHGDHADFLYTWMRIPVPADKIGAVRALSESVTYDPLKQEVRARCHFMGANVGTLVLAKRVAADEMTAAAAKGAYRDTIQGAETRQGYVALVRELQTHASSLRK